MVKKVKEVVETITETHKTPSGHTKRKTTKKIIKPKKAPALSDKRKGNIPPTIQALITTNEKIEKMNDISLSLQKVMLSLIKKTNDLNEKIDSLLDLYIEAAESFSGKKVEEIKPEVNVKERRTMAASGDKLDELIEQNKIIAKGLLLLEKYVKEQLQEKEKHVIERTTTEKVKPLPEFNF